MKDNWKRSFLLVTADELYNFSLKRKIRAHTKHISESILAFVSQHWTSGWPPALQTCRREWVLSTHHWEKLNKQLNVIKETMGASSTPTQLSPVPHAQKYFLPQVAFVGCQDLQQMWGKGHSSETTGQNPNSQIISVETFLTSDFGLKILMQPSNSKHHINWDVLPKTS